MPSVVDKIMQAEESGSSTGSNIKLWVLWSLGDEVGSKVTMEKQTTTLCSGVSTLARAS